MGDHAYLDIKNGVLTKLAWKDLFTRVALSDLLAINNSKASLTIDFKNYSIPVPNKYTRVVYSSKALENFIVTAYLLKRIKASERSNRSDITTTKMGVALYHGMRPMIVDAQSKLPPNSDLNDWSILEAQLIKDGKSDDVNYVNQVVQ